MSSRPYRGVFTIPVTPFNEDGSLDLDGLKEVVEFCIAAGAHGIVAPVNASEFSALGDSERTQVVECIAAVNNNRLPFVVGTSSVSLEAAVGFARHAADHGAHALIAIPPYVRKPHLGEIRRYYESLATTTDLPFFIQNHPIGVPMSAAFLGELCRDVPNILYIKEEIAPVTHSVTADIETFGDLTEGIFGGQAGKFILEELRRGAAGTMPACEVTDIHVQLWNAYQAEGDTGARKIFNRLVPLLNFESLHSINAYKEVLRRRGIIKSAYVRSSDTKPLDKYDHAELDILLSEIEDLFLV